METDSLAVRQYLLGPNHFNNPYYVLFSKWEGLLERDWVVEVKHIFKVDNSVADGIANWDVFQPLGEHLLNSPPLGVQPTLLADQQGLSTAHWVVSM